MRLPSSLKKSTLYGARAGWNINTRILSDITINCVPTTKPDETPPSIRVQCMNAGKLLWNYIKECLREYLL